MRYHFGDDSYDDEENKYLEMAETMNQAAVLILTLSSFAVAAAKRRSCTA